jgi:hypothetical protein
MAVRRYTGSSLPSPLRGGVGGGGSHKHSARFTPLPDPPPQGGREKS